ncbi:hypothetical protein B0T14DRAFT_531744 [Immersiella caudata]|uniref:Uncharacterized protein n=1 Tax=Immersiella caudata TaxID=314043 RepID=A0AA39WBF6_9PEZI|nr:hypothetical protein B0T14DRAFT_531744 [Immersiella caudata]
MAIQTFISIASLALTASALGFGGYGDSFLERVGPFDANSTQFLRAIEQSNATAVFRIPGYDVSKPFPGEPMDGWTFGITALDFSHLPGDQFTSRNRENAMVGYSMKIQAPDGLLTGSSGDATRVVRAHESWGMCLYSWGHPDSFNKTQWNNPSQKPLSADGSCKGFLSDACIALIEQRALSTYAISVVSARNESKNPFGSMVKCDSFLLDDVEDACGEYGPGNAGGYPLPSRGGVPVPYLNGSVTNSDGWLFERDKGEIYNSTKDLHSYWDSMVLNYWPVLAVWVNGTIDKDADDSKRRKLTTLSCVAPNGVGTGKAAFTFSGTAPAVVGGDKNGAGAAGDKKNGAGALRPEYLVILTALALTSWGFGW